MTQTYRFKVDKLIRDKLPDIVKTEEDTFLDFHVLNDIDYQNALKNKLIEESHEVHSAETREDMTDELADVMEVFQSLINSFSLSFEEIVQRQNKRRMERGGFSKKIYCHHVSVSEKNPKRLNYYKDRPDQYPEIK